MRVRVSGNGDLLFLFYVLKHHIAMINLGKFQKISINFYFNGKHVLTNVHRQAKQPELQLTPHYPNLQVIYQTRVTVFHHISKPREES